MANQSVNQGIKDSWSLSEFKNAHGKAQLGSFQAVDQETGEIRNFKSLIFTSPTGARVFASFSSKMEELTPAEIKAQLAELQVVELNSGTYKVCRVGENQWENIDI